MHLRDIHFVNASSGCNKQAGPQANSWKDSLTEDFEKVTKRLDRFGIEWYTFCCIANLVMLMNNGLQMIKSLNPPLLEKVLKILNLDSEEIFSVLIQYGFPGFYCSDSVALLCCHFFLLKLVYAQIFLPLFWSCVLSWIYSCVSKTIGRNNLPFLVCWSKSYKALHNLFFLYGDVHGLQHALGQVVLVECSFLTFGRKYYIFIGTSPEKQTETQTLLTHFAEY